MGRLRAKAAAVHESHFERNWREAWPDALAFGVGILVAAVFGWKTSELVWSLWLSTTVVGLTYLGWIQAGQTRLDWVGAAAKTPFRRRLYRVLMVVLIVPGFVGTSLHFAGFQVIHSAAIDQYFPISATNFFPVEDPWAYWQLLKQYWYFLPSALLAERELFGKWPLPGSAEVKLWGQGAMYKVYLRVIRMHLLLMLFAVVQPESLFMYALFYGIYFFPWSLFKRPAKPEADRR